MRMRQSTYVVDQNEEPKMQLQDKSVVDGCSRRYAKRASLYCTCFEPKKHFVHLVQYVRSTVHVQADG